MKKNSFLTFICACMPGFGQMYLGYMKRGVSLALTFWVLIFASAFFNTPIFLILLPIIWAYSFFDTFNIRNLSPEQLANFPDRYIVSSTEIKQITKNFPFLKNKNFSKIVGYVLIFIGVYAGYNSLLGIFSGAIFERSSTIYYFLNSLPSFIIFLFVVLLGVHMIGSGKKAPSSDDAEEYFVPTPAPETKTFATANTENFAPALLPKTTNEQTPPQTNEGE